MSLLAIIAMLIHYATITIFIHYAIIAIFIYYTTIAIFIYYATIAIFIYYATIAIFIYYAIFVKQIDYAVNALFAYLFCYYCYCRIFNIFSAEESSIGKCFNWTVMPDLFMIAIILCYSCLIWLWLNILSYCSDFISLIGSDSYTMI